MRKINEPADRVMRVSLSFAYDPDDAENETLSFQNVGKDGRALFHFRAFK